MSPREAMRLRIIMPRRLSNESATVKCSDRPAGRFGFAGQGFLQARPECFLPSFHVGMSQEKCRWGILGVLESPKKLAVHPECRQCRTGCRGGRRDVGGLKDFIDRCSARVPHPVTPKAIGNYDEMLANEEIDAIYLPLPTGLRAEWAIKAAQAGKHLLCEKPCGIDLAELDEILAACKEAGVQFMDGVMFMHSDRLKDLRKTLDDGESVGKLRRIATQFSFCAPEEFLTGNIRMHSDLEPQGCMGDLGWYNLRFILWTMNYQVPRAVTGRLLNASGRSDSPKPVPTEFSGEVLFDGDVSASYYCSFLTEHQQFAHLSGTKERPDRRLRFAFLRKPDRAYRVQCKLRLRRLRLPHGATGTLKSRPRNIRAVIRPLRSPSFSEPFPILL